MCLPVYVCRELGQTDLPFVAHSLSPPDWAEHTRGRQYVVTQLYSCQYNVVTLIKLDNATWIQCFILYNFPSVTNRTNMYMS